MMLPNAFGPGPLGLRLCVHSRHGPHGIGFVHVIETTHHHPLGCAVGAPEVPTEHSIDSTGHKLRSLLAKKPFLPLEPLGRPSVPYSWDWQGSK
jgi:hypothetical protein